MVVAPTSPKLRLCFESFRSSVFSPMEWTRGPTIGRGASAAVSIATTASGELFAVKSAELSRSGFLQREQHFLSQLSSPHVVEYLGFEITCESDEAMYNLFMEYIPGGTLSDAMKRQGGSFNESMIRLYTNQILQGLDYLHLNGLAHCDIKGQNVLMGKDGVKIADLGCARLVENESAATFSGTPVFMAPEVARGEEQGFPADVWALGCTIIEMATGSTPWPEVNDPVSALYRIGFSGDLPEFPGWFSKKAKDFLSKCLKRDSKERWTAKQLLQHPFLEDLESNSEKPDEFATNSPTGVLDQGFWDSLEVLEAPRNLTHIGSSSNSPAEIIRRLIGGTSSSDSNLPNWTWDEDWVTIRSNGQTCSMNPDDEQLIDTESYMFSAVDLEEYGNSIAIEDLIPDCSVCPICVIECFSVWRDFVIPCENVTDVFVRRILTAVRKLMKVLFLFNSSVLSSFNPWSLVSHFHFPFPFSST